MNSTFQYHSDRFRLIEEDASLSAVDLQKFFAMQMRTTKRFVSAEQRNRRSATATLAYGPYGTCSQGEFDGLCGSFLD